MPTFGVHPWQAPEYADRLDELAPAGIDAHALLKRYRAEVLQSGVKLHLGVEIEHIGGHIGDFSARLSDGQEIRAGAVILAMGAQPYTPSEFGYGSHPHVITNLDLEGMWDNVPGERVTIVGSMTPSETRS